MKGGNLLPHIQKARYVMSDLVTTAIAFLLFNIYRFYLLDRPGDLWDFVFSDKLIAEQIIFPIAALGIYWLSGYYNLPFGKSRLQEFVTTFCSAVINATIIYFVLLINDQTGRRLVNYEMILSLLGLMFIIPYIGRFILTSVASVHFRRHQWQFNCVIVGNSERARATARRLVEDRGRVDYSVAGYVAVSGETNVSDDGVVIQIDDLDRFCREENIDQIVIALQHYSDEKVMQILSRLFSLEIPVKIAPDTLSYVTSAIRLNDIYGEPFVDLTAPVLSESARNIKRTFDVCVSVFMLIILSPLYLLIALLVKTGSKGKVLYSQERVGKLQRPFRIYKFRTMVEDAEQGVPMLSKDDDPRITPIGRILRKYRLDELPQFWNVLKGDMSIVGPRPERRYFIDKIMERAPYYALVYQVRPGITSWGMVKYGYASSLGEMIERTRFDLIYMSNMSLTVDMKILIYTVKTIIKGKGK